MAFTSSPSRQRLQVSPINYPNFDTITLGMRSPGWHSKNTALVYGDEILIFTILDVVYCAYNASRNDTLGSCVTMYGHAVGSLTTGITNSVPASIMVDSFASFLTKTVKSVGGDLFKGVIKGFFFDAVKGLGIIGYDMVSNIKNTIEKNYANIKDGKFPKSFLTNPADLELLAGGVFPPLGDAISAVQFETTISSQFSLNINAFNLVLRIPFWFTCNTLIHWIDKGCVILVSELFNDGLTALRNKADVTPKMLEKAAAKCMTMDLKTIMDGPEVTGALLGFCFALTLLFCKSACELAANVVSFGIDSSGLEQHSTFSAQTLCTQVKLPPWCNL